MDEKRRQYLCVKIRFLSGKKFLKYRLDNILILQSAPDVAILILLMFCLKISKGRIYRKYMKRDKVSEDRCSEREEIEVVISIVS